MSNFKFTAGLQCGKQKARLREKHHIGLGGKNGDICDPSPENLEVMVFSSNWLYTM